MLIYNAIIFPMDRLENPDFHFNGWLRFEGKSIIAMGPGTPETIDDKALDARGRVLMPGMIDAHSHLGMIGDSLGFEGDDVNEDSDPVTPHLRAIDGIHPLDRGFYEARLAGVTTVLTGPGSANTIGGALCAIKTDGICTDDMIVCENIAMKFALGENPKSCYHQKNSGPETRMASAALIREALQKAVRYLEDVDAATADPDNNSLPEYDAKCEALIPVLRREMQAHFHAHRADDICTAIRIAKEFNLDYRLVHCTEGHLITEILKRENASAFLGPFMLSRSKPELTNEKDESPRILRDAGVHFALITDHPELPQKYLHLTALLAIKNGLSPYEAFAAVTSVPAALLNLSDRIGSLKPGLDADMILWKNDPISFFAETEYVWINGNLIAN